MGDRPQFFRQAIDAKLKGGLSSDEYKALTTGTQHHEIQFLLAVLDLRVCGIMKAEDLIHLVSAPESVSEPAAELDDRLQFFHKAIDAKTSGKLSFDDYKPLTSAVQHHDAQFLTAVLDLRLEETIGTQDLLSMVSIPQETVQARLGDERHLQDPSIIDRTPGIKEGESRVHVDARASENTSANNLSASAANQKTDAPGEVTVNTLTQPSTGVEIHASDRETGLSTFAGHTENTLTIPHADHTVPSHEPVEASAVLPTPLSAHGEGFGIPPSSLKGQNSSLSSKFGQFTPSMLAQTSSPPESPACDVADQSQPEPPNADNTGKMMPKSSPPNQASGLAAEVSESVIQNTRAQGSGHSPQTSGDHRVQSSKTLKWKDLQLHPMLVSALQVTKHESPSDGLAALQKLYQAHQDSALALLTPYEATRNFTILSFVVDAALKANDELVRKEEARSRLSKNSVYSDTHRLPKGSYICELTLRPHHKTFTPSVLILVPYGWVGQQVTDRLAKLLEESSLPLSVGCFYKGCDVIRRDKQDFFPATDIVTMTAGKCAQLLQDKIIDLQELKLTVWLKSEKIFAPQGDDMRGRRPESPEDLSRKIGSIFKATRQAVSVVRQLLVIGDPSGYAVNQITHSLRTAGGLESIMEVGFTDRSKSMLSEQSSGTPKCLGDNTSRKRPAASHSGGSEERAQKRQKELVDRSPTGSGPPVLPIRDRSSSAALQDTRQNSTSWQGSQAVQPPRADGTYSTLLIDVKGLHLQCAIKINLKKQSAEAIVGGRSDSKFLNHLDHYVVLQNTNLGAKALSNTLISTPKPAVPMKEVSASTAPSSLDMQRPKRLGTSTSGPSPKAANTKYIGPVGITPNGSTKSKITGGEVTSALKTSQSAPQNRPAASPSLKTNAGVSATKNASSSQARDGDTAAPQKLPLAPSSTAKSAVLPTSRPSKPKLRNTIENIYASAICPVQTTQPHCSEECGMLGVCWDINCNGEYCHKVHDRPCVQWLFHQCIGSSREKCPYSHDERWKKDVYKRKKKHQAEMEKAEEKKAEGKKVEEKRK